MKRAFLILLMAAPLARGQEYFPPPDSEGGWRTLKDAAQIRKSAGMDLQKLDWAFDYASRSSQHGGLSFRIIQASGMSQIWKCIV